MLFVPCVNPDGYLYNEKNHPDGGGLWRKNRRRNEDGTFGVDLNRNYGFKWGYDNLGSSAVPESEVYRGPAAFSEPETQAIRYLCLQHNFKIALNYHAYGNFLIYPYGYTTTPSDANTTFDNLTSILSQKNRYFFGTGLETVGYHTNGDADDWMYGEKHEKLPIFAITPEVGSKDDWFWPPVSRILQLCKATVFQNLQAASFLLDHAIIVDESDAVIESKHGEWRFKIINLGFDETGFVVRVRPISDNITFDLSTKIIYSSVSG